MLRNMLKRIKKSVLYLYFFITLLIQVFISSNSNAQDTTELEYETYTEVWVSSDSNYQEYEDSSYNLFDDYYFDSVLKTKPIQIFERKATPKEPQDDELVRWGKVQHQYIKIDTPLKAIKKKDTFRVIRQYNLDSIMKIIKSKPLNESEPLPKPKPIYRLDLLAEIKRYGRPRWIPNQNI